MSLLKKNLKIPYGVCRINDNKFFERIEEKPRYEFLINTGVYLINKKVISTIKPNKKLDMNTLINKIKAKNLKLVFIQLMKNLGLMLVSGINIINLFLK